MNITVKEIKQLMLSVRQKAKVEGKFNCFVVDKAFEMLIKELKDAKTKANSSTK